MKKLLVLFIFCSLIVSIYAVPVQAGPVHVPKFINLSPDTAKKVAKGVVGVWMAAGSLFMLTDVMRDASDDLLQFKFDYLFYKAGASLGYAYVIFKILSAAVNKLKNHEQNNSQNQQKPDRIKSLSKAIGASFISLSSIIMAIFSPSLFKYGPYDKNALNKILFAGSYVGLGYSLYDLLPKAYKNFKLALNR